MVFHLFLDGDNTIEINRLAVSRPINCIWISMTNHFLISFIHIHSIYTYIQYMYIRHRNPNGGSFGDVITEVNAVQR